MAENINMRVNLSNDKQVIDALKEIESLASQLNGRKIKLDIKANGIRDAKKDVNNCVKALGDLESAQEKAASTAGKAAAAYGKESAELTKVKEGLEKAGKAQKELNSQSSKNASKGGVTGSGKAKGALGSIASGLATRAIGGAVIAVGEAFGEAFNSMTAVDNELAKIQRDSGASDEAMKQLGDSSYDAASKFGVSAAEYLQNVGVFTKANYGDAAQGMAELSLQTQLIGDMSAETASRFLMAADAAFGLEQNTDALSEVLEKANNIDNAYAVSLESIAAGMPLVSDTAAAAGMSVEETMAMLAAITEATGQTGEDAAATAQELITGIVESTSGEMNGLTEVLQNYAGEALAA